MTDTKLELVVEVDANRASTPIKSVNSSLSSMEAAAAKSAHGAAQGIDGMTAAMVKGATAGNLLADAIKSEFSWAREFVVGSILVAAGIRRRQWEVQRDSLQALAIPLPEPTPDTWRTAAWNRQECNSGSARAGVPLPEPLTGQCGLTSDPASALPRKGIDQPGSS